MPTLDDISTSLMALAKLIITSPHTDKITVEAVTRVGCTDIVSEPWHGKFSLSGIDSAYDAVTRLFHTYAHVIAAARAGDSLVNAGGRHRAEFAALVDDLGGDLLYTGTAGYAFHITAPLDTTEKMEAAVTAFAQIQRYLNGKRTSNRHRSGYDRTTLTCPSCTYTLTLRTAAAQRLTVTCNDHERVMTP